MSDRTTTADGKAADHQEVRALARATSGVAEKRIHAVDLFCGIGGLTHGLGQAGIHVKAGIDNDPTCQYAFEANNLGAEFVCKSVREISFRDLDEYYSGAEVTALVGCAPCQPFSAHNRGAAESEADCSLVGEFARLVAEGKPDLVSMENVQGLARHPSFASFTETLTNLDYDLSYGVVSCERLGVPQKRRRLVLLASRLGSVALPDGEAEPPSVADCIRDLPAIGDGDTCEHDLAHTALSLTPTNRERITQSKPGGSWADWDDDLINECHKKTHYPAPYGRMGWDDLAPTITTQFCYYSTGRFGHPEQNRSLSIREGALLQTFPRDYLLVDPEDPPIVRELARHVGNAVPVELGAAIGNAFWESLNGR